MSFLVSVVSAAGNESGKPLRVLRLRKRRRSTVLDWILLSVSIVLIGSVVVVDRTSINVDVVTHRVERLNKAISSDRSHLAKRPPETIIR